MSRLGWRRLLPAAALAAAVAGGAWRRGVLTGDGALAAAATGDLVCVGGGWGWGSGMVAFFLSSSALSRLQQRRKDDLAAIWEKGSRRDAGQVLANGGAPVLAALWQGLFPGSVPSAAYFGALAASTADTWATEVGVLQNSPPRLITTLRRVPRGTSGGVTPVGSLASLAGALFMAGIAAAVRAGGNRGDGTGAAIAIGGQATGGLRSLASGEGHLRDGDAAVAGVRTRRGRSAGGSARARLFAATLAGGIAGSVTDSLLGATVQAVYCCPRCQGTTEQRVHRCGAVTELQRGHPWITNDAVNLLASMVGAATAALLAVGTTCRRGGA